MSNIESRLAAIESRNAKVELDKKWEGSVTRKILLMIFTYLAIAGYFFAIDVENPWLNAVVPSLGFLLSTLTLPFFKRIWSKYHS